MIQRSIAVGVLLSATLLSACTMAERQRALVGVGIGAATGVAIGAVTDTSVVGGALVGAGAGAAIGALTAD